MLQLYPRSGAVHLLNAIDRPLLLVEGNAGPWTQTPFQKNICFLIFFGTLQVNQRELEERCQSLVTAVPLTQQEQRLFTVGQLHQGYQWPRLIFAQLVCWLKIIIVFIIFFGTLQARQRKLEGRCQSLVTIPLTQQEPTETCLTYRLFAVGQLHHRYRRLRLFFAQLVCRVAARAHPTRHLCGVDSDADERVKMLGACLMLGAVEEACLRWTAVEGMDREVSRGSFGRGRGRGARRGCLFLFTF